MHRGNMNTEVIERRIMAIVGHPMTVRAVTDNQKIKSSDRVEKGRLQRQGDEAVERRQTNEESSTNRRHHEVKV